MFPGGNHTCSPDGRGNSNDSADISVAARVLQQDQGSGVVAIYGMCDKLGSLSKGYHARSRRHRGKLPEDFVRNLNSVSPEDTCQIWRQGLGKALQMLPVPGNNFTHLGPKAQRVL